MDEAYMVPNPTSPTRPVILTLLPVMDATCA